MPSSLKTLLFAVLFLLTGRAVYAQDNDYLKHRKSFDICSIKKQCSECYECNQNRYVVKIENKSDKKIKHVFYKFYSPVFNKVLEKEAKVSGDKIPGRQTGMVYVCVLDVRHWIFSRIVYSDESSVTFTLHDRYENFVQEPDECDCND